MIHEPAHIGKKEILITGFGGQGIVLAGTIIGKAAALGDRRESTLVQSYGPESRGGACSAQVIIDDRKIHYPYVRKADILVSMSQSGYEKYIGDLRADGLLIIDQDLVVPGEHDRDLYAIPSTRIAEEMGRKMIANIVMTGFFGSVSGLISWKALEDIVTQSVPRGTEELNLNALKKGWEFGTATLKSRAKRAAGHAGVGT